MLNKFQRLRFINETGQTMTYNDGARIAIRIQPWKFTSGALVYGTIVTEDLGFGAADTIADNGEEESTVIDNSSDLFLGYEGTFEVTHDLDAAIGVCRLYLEESDNDGNWPSDSDDFVITDLRLIAVLPIDNSNTDKSRSVNFSF